MSRTCRYAETRILVNGTAILAIVCYHYVLPSLLPVKSYLLSSSISGLLAHSSHTTSLNITKNTKQQNKFSRELLRQLPQKTDATNCQAIYFISKHASDKILKIAFH